MPTVSSIGAYRFFCYAGDRDALLPIHAEREDKEANFWLDPIQLQSSGGWARAEIARLQKIMLRRQASFVEAWNDYFND